MKRSFILKCVPTSWQVTQGGACRYIEVEAFMNKFHKITICLDMAGCPNRCKHCWIGASPNKQMEKRELIRIADTFRGYSDKVEIFSWYREPDFRNDYKELWEEEIRLSNEKENHFELASIWRLVRDDTYADWLYDLGVRKCQLTLFGTEVTTDYYVGRKGAYREILDAIEILFQHRIAPRIQIFVNQQNLSELEHIEALCRELELEKRCRESGQNLELFAHQGSCDGENAKLYDIRITEEDLQMIPEFIAEHTLRYMGAKTLQDVFGKPEQILCDSPKLRKEKHVAESENPVFYIDANFNVFPNETSPYTWWKLGNIRTDGVESILQTYQQGSYKAKQVMKNVPIEELIENCGNKNSRRLFTEGDYYMYLVNSFCAQEGDIL